MSNNIPTIEDLAETKEYMDNINEFESSVENEFEDRDGKTRLTVNGVINKADEDITAAILETGYTIVGDFSDVVKVEITEPNQVYTSKSVLGHEADTWRCNQTLPYAPTGDDPTTGDELGKWVNVSSISLLQAVAISVGTAVENVILATNKLDPVVGYIHDVGKEITYAVPSDSLSIGEVIVSFSGTGVLQTTSATTQLQTVGESSRQLANATTKDIFIVYGQSNAQGYGGHTEGAPVNVTDLVKVWDGTNQIELTSYTPMAHGGTTSGSAWAAFGNEFARMTGRKALLGNCAFGSQSIQDLQKGEENPNYSNMIAWFTGMYNSVVAEGYMPKVYVLFHQGEQDIIDLTTPNDYRDRFRNLVADLKADIGMESIFICPVGGYTTTGINDKTRYTSSIQSAQWDLIDNYDDTYCGFSEFASLSEYKRDSVHLNQIGYNIMGAAYAKAVVNSVLKTNGGTHDDNKGKGVLLTNPSQRVKSISSWFNKYLGDWLVTNNSVRMSYGVVSVEDAGDHLKITLDDKYDFFTFTDCVQIRNGNADLKISADIHNNFYSQENGEGRTILSVYLTANVSISVDTSDGSINNYHNPALVKSLFTATRAAIGTVTLGYAGVNNLITAVSRGISPTDYIIPAIDTGSTYATLHCFDPSNPTVKKDGNVSLSFIDMPIPPSVLDDGYQFMFKMEAARKLSF